MAVEQMNVEHVLRALIVAPHLRYVMNDGHLNFWELLVASGLMAGHVAQIDTTIWRDGRHAARLTWITNDNAPSPPPISDTFAATSLLHVKLRHEPDIWPFAVKHTDTQDMGDIVKRRINIVAQKEALELYASLRKPEGGKSEIMRISADEMPYIRNGVVSVPEKLDRAALLCAEGRIPVIDNGDLCIMKP